MKGTKEERKEGEKEKGRKDRKEERERERVSLTGLSIHE